MAWQFDMPSGTFKDHSLSPKVRREVVEDLQFAKFATNEPGYGKKKGQSITITRILQLGLASRVGELDRLPRGRPAVTTKAATVSEWGYAIPWSNFEASLSHYELPSEFEGMLRDQMARTVDKMNADAVKLTPIRYRPMLSGGVITTNGAFSGVADKNLDVSDLRVIYDYLRDNLKCPRFRNDKYIGILSTTAARGIKNDPLAEAWKAPTSSEQFVKGTLFDAEGFILLETNHPNALSRLAGTSTVLGEAVFFGADAFANLIVQEPEIRMSLPLQDDLGRFREVGWVGIMEAFLVWEQAALARAVYVGSN